MTISQKPWSTKQNPDGTWKLCNANGDEIGTIKDPQDAELVVARVNSTGGYSTYGGNS